MSRPTVLDERQLQLPGSGILYDALRWRNPAPEMFTHAYWVERGAHQEFTGGRASVSFVRAGDARWVLRHYRRGGLAARVLSDQYLWLGAERTRCFSEWRLLARLVRLGLPVPAPVGARYVRNGVCYRADLITEQLPAAVTLAQALADPVASREAGSSGSSPSRAIAGSSAAGAGASVPVLDRARWQAVGETIARFHALGVHHADLNAHNILLGQDGAAVYVLDFDRGRIRPRGSWEAQVLARLQRSLLKIQAAQGLGESVFGERQWGWLMAGYAQRESVRS